VDLSEEIKTPHVSVVNFLESILSILTAYWVAKKPQIVRPLSGSVAPVSAAK
jgi:hypothetical protein